ncbi:MAG: efflux RND transporter periplasmic adaptor subunit [Betaproteobacteria bacterium]|nr:efflux RND transporter periplasmic adaptor subunit [Betaproteobacteria bacterium]
MAMLAVASAPLLATAQLATAVAEMRQVDQSYPAEGVVEAVKQSTLAAQIAGRIVELRVDAGQAVAKGQVLARIDEREAAQAVAESEARIARAEADAANTRATYERTKRLVEQKFVSQAALDKALADFESAQAQVSASRAGSRQAAAARTHTVIVAPFSGIVSTRHVELGEMASPGRPIVTLFDPKDLRVVASVPQARLAEIRAHASATIEFPSLQQRIKAAQVTVLPSADARTHTTQVRAELPDALRGTYPGMFARVRFATGRVAKLLIPARAVVYRSEVAGAYVVGEKGEVQFRQLRLGEPAGEEGIEVLAGVVRGERVALDPAAALSQLRRPK